MNSIMKKGVFSTILIGAVVVSIGMFSTYHARKVSDPSAPLHTSLRLKWLYDPGFAGEMVAAKKGFFAAQGITVDILPGGFEADPIKLVAAGSDTFGVAGADSFLLARAKGVPIVAIAAGYQQTPVVYYVYVHADSGINSPNDFIGKRVGYQAGQDTATVYEALLAQAGIDRTLVHEIPITYDMTPFVSRQVEVWPGYAASQSYALEQKGVPYQVVAPSMYGVDFLGTVYFTTESFMKEYPEAVQAFVDGMIEGWNYTYSNHEDVIPLIASYDEKSLTPNLIRSNLAVQKDSILPHGSRFGEFTQDEWEHTQAILVSQKLLDTPVDLTQAVTNRFLDEHYK